MDQPPEGEGWTHEIKYDGYRTEIVLENGSCRIFTRNAYDWTDKYKPVASAAETLTCQTAIIDGEMIVQDEQGRSDFRAVSVAIHSAPERLVFMAFDLLHLDGLIFAESRSRPAERRWKSCWARTAQTVHCSSART